MSCVRVTCPPLVAALRQGAAERYVAVLRMGPAAVIEEPPVVRAEVPGVALAEIHARPVVLRHPGEGEETEGAEGQRQDQHGARPAFAMETGRAAGGERVGQAV